MAHAPLLPALIGIQEIHSSWNPFTTRTYLHEDIPHTKIVFHEKEKKKKHNHRYHYPLLTIQTKKKQTPRLPLMLRSLWYLPVWTKLSQIFPDDVLSAVIQTVCVTKCVGSLECLPLHGWVRLGRLPNPFASRLFSRQWQIVPHHGGTQLLASPAGRLRSITPKGKKLQGTFV